MQTSIKLVNIGIKCAIRHGSTSEVPVGGVGCPFGRNKTTKKKKKLGGAGTTPEGGGEIHRRPRRWPQQMEQCWTYLFLYSGPNGVRLTAAKQRGHRLRLRSSVAPLGRATFVRCFGDDECAAAEKNVFSLNLIRQMHSGAQLASFSLHPTLQSLGVCLFNGRTVSPLSADERTFFWRPTSIMLIFPFYFLVDYSTSRPSTTQLVSKRWEPAIGRRHTENYTIRRINLKAPFVFASA